MQRRTFFVTEACFRHIPLRTVRTRFRVHRSPVLTAMTSRGASYLWPWEAFSLFKDITPPRHSALTLSTCRPSLPHLSMASSVP
jgi:hypothetical protein